jgi:transposase
VLWDGSALPLPLQERLQREWERLKLVEEQIRDLKRQREEAVAAAADPSLKQIQRLATLKGIGLTSAWLFVREFFGWRSRAKCLAPQFLPTLPCPLPPPGQPA